MRPLLALLCLPSFAASAQDIHECVSGQEIACQSEPYGPGQVYPKTWGTEPTSSSAHGEVRHSPPPAVDPGYLARLARRARSGAGPGTAIRQAGNPRTSCEDAKRMRDAFLESEHGRNTG